jgi:hypothetical protein
MRDALPHAPDTLPDVRTVVEEHSRRVAAARVAAASLGDDPALAMLRRALVEDVGHSARAVTDQMAMHHGRRRVDRIVGALAEPAPQEHAMAVELLEVLTGRETGERVVALLDPESGGSDAYTPPNWSAADWVADLAMDPENRWDDSWLRACAIHAAPSVLGPSAAAEVVRPWVHDEDGVVAETARWALARS